VDVFHRVGTFELAPEQESSSFFRESLDEWTDLDCTAQFSAFAAEVWPLTDSLALVLFNREKVRPLSVPSRLRFPSAGDAVGAVCACAVCGVADC
jgi:hypothetical protein